MPDDRKILAQRAYSGDEAAMEDLLLISTSEEMAGMSPRQWAHKLAEIPPEAEGQFAPPDEVATTPEHEFASVVRMIRPVSMDRPDGGQSSVLFAHAGNKVWPTLFPAERGRETSDPADWVDLSKDPGAARQIAEQRMEVFEFPTPEEAQFIAEGGWKPKPPPPEELNPDRNTRLLREGFDGKPIKIAPSDEEGPITPLIAPREQ